MNTLFEINRNEGVVVIPFPELDLEQPMPATAAAAAEAALPERSSQSDAEWEVRLQMACEEAAASARELCETRFHDRLEVERSAIAMACTSLQHARERYFSDMEAEVVRLAIAVAVRILRRETAMDPMLLAGIVRHALSELNDSNGAVLVVAPEGVERWRTAMKSSSMRIEEDPSLAPGSVQLRASAGVAELGLEAQLVEIERGFFDLLARRPA